MHFGSVENKSEGLLPESVQCQHERGLEWKWLKLKYAWQPTHT